MKRVKIVAFNYEAIDNEAARGQAMDHAVNIHRLLKNGTAGIIEIGGRLNKAHQLLGRKRFATWCRVEFRFSQSVASNFMQIAAKFADLPHLEKYHASALYALARRAVDERAIRDCADVARGGEIVSKAAALEAIARYAPAAKVSRPDAVHQLRHQVRRLAGVIGNQALADELINLALELRTASRAAPTEAPEANEADNRAQTKPAPEKPTTRPTARPTPVPEPRPTMPYQDRPAPRRPAAELALA